MKTYATKAAALKAAARTAMKNAATDPGAVWTVEQLAEGPFAGRWMVVRNAA